MPVKAPFTPALTSPAATTAPQDHRNDKGRSKLKGQGSYGGIRAQKMTTNPELAGVC